MSKRGKSGGKQKATSASASTSLTSPLSASAVSALWSDLRSLLANRDKEDVDHQAVREKAEKVFNSSLLSSDDGGDALALDVLSVSLLSLGEWESAASLLAQHATLRQRRPTLALNYAYALYRAKQHNQAIDEIKTMSSSASSRMSGGVGEAALLHLQAQANYRAGQYSAAAKIYTETSLKDDDDVELQANTLAALVSAGMKDEAKRFMDKIGVERDPDSYELAYNGSCCLIERGEYVAALRLLRRAQSICRELLKEEGLSEDEIENELALLYVQEAYMLQQLSKTAAADGSEQDAALALYQRVLALKPTDRNVMAIASNNIITLRSAGSGKIWDSLKKSGRAMEMELRDATVSARQRSVIQLNRALVLYHSNQINKCRDLLTTLAREFPHNVHIHIALAAAKAKDKDKSRAKDADDVITQWLRSNESTASADAVQTAHLALAHLALLRGDSAAAAKTLNKLASSNAGREFAHRPGMVATLAALYDRASDVAAADAAIQAAITYWRSAAKSGNTIAPRQLGVLLASAAQFYSHAGRESEAANLLEQLAAESHAASASSSGSGAARSDQVARLVLAYYRDDASKSASYAARLPQLSIPADMNVERLESVPAPQMIRKKKATTSGKQDEKKKKEDEESESDEEEEGATAKASSASSSAPSASLAQSSARLAAIARRKARRKARRAKRYPKGFDPANPGPPPDPERWLPKWERSNQRKYNRGRRQQTNAIRGAQGSTNVAAAAQVSAQTESSHEVVESRGKVSGAAAAAARKRAAKRR